MNTKQAFEKLITDPELREKAKLNASTVRTWRKRMLAGTLTLDVMEEVLYAAGAKKTPEKWTFKKK